MKDSIAKINAVLENHKEVITQLCEKCEIELDNNNANSEEETSNEN
jgi:heterodisulfide reductase subunit B